jgi:hypothetical protein
MQGCLKSCHLKTTHFSLFNQLNTITLAFLVTLERIFSFMQLCRAFPVISSTMEESNIRVSFVDMQCLCCIINVF